MKWDSTGERSTEAPGCPPEAGPALNENNLYKRDSCSKHHTWALG